MLQAGENTVVRFNVDVHGTKAQPDVRLVIAVQDHELGFVAMPDGEKWKADINIPGDIPAGSYDMRVEVTINSRLFTPLKRKVTIDRPGLPAAAPAPAPAPQESTAASEAKDFFKRILAQEGKPVPVAPTQTREQTHEWEGEGGALPEKKEVPIPLPPEKVVPSTTPAPSPSVPSPSPVKEAKRINIAEIVADSNRRFDKVLSESKTYKKPIKEVAEPIVIKPQTPVSLKKGKVVYE